MKSNNTLICAYTPERLHPDTKAAVMAAKGRLVRMRDFDSYYELFKRLWKDKKSFVLLEHDAVPAEGAIQRLVQCKHDWCICPLPNGLSSGLSCVHISKKAIESLPNIWDSIDLRHWSNMDAWLGSHLASKFKQHYHENLLAHHHVDNIIEPKGQLKTRLQRNTKTELAVGFYDPQIEYQFASISLNKYVPAFQTEGMRKAHIQSELDRLNRFYKVGPSSL
jgi:hypothetical protein